MKTLKKITKTLINVILSPSTITSELLLKWLDKICLDIPKWMESDDKQSVMESHETGFHRPMRLKNKNNLTSKNKNKKKHE